MSSKLSIMYIENEPEMIDMVRLMLEHEGYSVRTATDGPTGLSALQKEPSDLILLDLMMPGMDGWETYKRIRTIDSLMHTPVIILTAKALPEDRAQGEAIGVSAYITKPFALRELISTIESIIKQSNTL